MAVTGQAFPAKFTVRGRGINFTSNAVGFQFFNGVEHLDHDGARADEANNRPVAFGRPTEQVHALDNPFIHAFRLGRHGVVLVVNGDVMEHVFVVNVHFFDAVANDGGQLVSKRRVPCPNSRVGMSHQKRVAVLVLQAFTVEGGSSRGGSHQETASTLVSRRPNEVGHPLEAEHGIEGVEGNRWIEVR